LYSTHVVAPRTPNSYFALRDKLRMSSPAHPIQGPSRGYSMRRRGESRRGANLVRPSANRREEALDVPGGCGGGFGGAVARHLWRGKRLAASEVLAPEGAAMVLEGAAFRAVPGGCPAASVNGVFGRLEEDVESCWLGGRRRLSDACGIDADEPEGGGKVRRLPTVGAGPSAVRGPEKAAGS